MFQFAFALINQSFRFYCGFYSMKCSTQAAETVFFLFKSIYVVI